MFSAMLGLRKEELVRAQVLVGAVLTVPRCIVARGQESGPQRGLIEINEAEIRATMEPARLRKRGNTHRQRNDFAN